ncbi:hypothetical protein D917_01933 [Trichinella nativa]|uniref:PiggyBac transposable element-derived protein domain-containing protein n=1 Tax=Trichinella nativa TaxID=6335 RepID=A0A1Y3EQI5_9BILA|nr:hypothetical protein D917_01933 [Trichinella nativa]
MNMEVSCLEDIEMEEYVDELENLAESLSDEDHLEEEGIFKPPPRPTENILRDKPGPTGKCKAAMTTEDVFHAQLSSDIIKLIVLQTNEEESPASLWGFSEALRRDVIRQLCRNIASSCLRLSLDSMIKPPELKGKAHPGAHITVDEQLILFHGRCFLIVRIKSKPGKYGIKVWVAADVEHCYTYNFHGYAGKIYNHPEKKQGRL